MTTIERTADLDAPIDRVFALITDESRITEWREGLISAERVGGPGPLDGSTYKETVMTPMGKQTMTVKLSAKSGEHTLNFTVLDGPVKPTGTIALSDLGGGRTRVAYSMKAKPMLPIASPIDAMVAQYMTTTVDKTLEKLKALVAG